MKEAIATIGRLEALGLQRYDIPLPKCIVLGKSPEVHNVKYLFTDILRRTIYREVFGD